MDRAKWYRIHSWVGLKVSILMSFILITGTLAVFSHEIDWLTNSAKRVDSDTVNGMNWPLVYQAAQQRYGDNKYQSLRAPRDPWFSAELVYFVDETQRRKAFFHPSTGEYLGEGRWYNWQRFFRMTHRHLMLPTPIGVSIVGLLGVLLFVSLITCFVIYPKWWQGFFRKPRTHHAKVFWGDMHRLLGVWSMWFIVIIAVTGIWYLVERWGGNASLPSRGTPQSSLAMAVPTNPSVDVFNQSFLTTAQVYPELVVKNIRFPAKEGQPFSFTGSSDAILVRPRANQVSFDPASGELLKVNRADELDWHNRISEAADPLHFGYFGGMTTKIIYFIFGVFTSALSLSGVYIFGMRVSKKPKADASPAKTYWRSAFANMKKGKWLSLVLLTVCTLLAATMFSGLYIV